MLGWTIGFVLWVLAILCFWRVRKNGGAKKFPVNAKWLFGIFIFLTAFDVWTTFFMIIWLGIATEANPIFGDSLTLSMAVLAKTGQILFTYFGLKFLSLILTEKNFHYTAVSSLTACCAVMFLVAVNNEFCFYKAVYTAVQYGFLF